MYRPINQRPHHLRSRDSNENRDTGPSSPEQCTPNGVEKRAEVAGGSSEVTDRIPLPHTSPARPRASTGLEGVCGSQAPDKSHTDTEEALDSEGPFEGPNETRAEGEDGDKEIDDGEQRAEKADESQAWADRGHPEKKTPSPPITIS
jgi:hypothetical protein